MRLPSVPASSRLAKKPHSMKGDGSSSAGPSSAFQADSSMSETPLATSMDSAGIPPHLVHELVFIRKLARLVLVPQLPSIHGDAEGALAPLDQVDLGPWNRSLDLGGQTGRPRKIASDHAVFDRDVHAAKISIPLATPPMVRSTSARFRSAGVSKKNNR